MSNVLKILRTARLSLLQNVRMVVTRSGVIASFAQPGAPKLTIAEGEKKVQDLKIGG